MEYTRWNKIIATFMGEDYEAHISSICTDLYNQGNRSIEIKNSVEPLIPFEYYHSSWKWLMPVVEKIESIEDPHHGFFTVDIVGNSCTIRGTNFRPDIIQEGPLIYLHDVVLEDKLMATYEAVLIFIKWYYRIIKKQEIEFEWEKYE